MKLVTLLLLSTLTLLIFPVSSTNNGKQEIQQLADITRDLPRSIRAEMIAQKYHFLYPLPDFTSYNTQALRSRFESANAAVFYSHDSAIAKEMRAIYEILHARGANQVDDLSAVVGAQIITRNFDAAREISEIQSLPEEFNIPDIENRVSDENSIWQIFNVGESKLIRDRYSIDKGKLVIVVSNPLCGFSAAATKAIESDSHLFRFFAENSLWLVPPARRLYSNEVFSWNKNHPFQKMALAYRASSWPIIDDWSTPIFYFIKDGKVIDKVVGWPKDGQNLTKLRASMDNFINRDLPPLAIPAVTGRVRG